MIVINTVYLVFHVYSKWYSIKAFITFTTPKTSGVVRLAHRLEYLQIENGTFLDRWSSLV